MVSLSSIIDRRQRALMAKWVNDPLIPVLVESTAALKGLVFLDVDTRGASVGPIGRRASAKCAMVRGGPDMDSSWSVWVAADYEDYRGAYSAFLRAAYGIKADPAQLAAYDIDHLLNKARAPKPSTFVRIEAVTSEANQAWGGVFEKPASDPRFTANTTRERRTMSYMICAKLAGLMPPKGREDLGGIERLVTFFRNNGINDREARDGINNMMSFAFKFKEDA